MTALFTAADWAELRAVHAGLLDPGACLITPAVPAGQTATPRTVDCALLTQPVDSGDGGASGTLRRPMDRTVALPFGDAVKAGDTILWRSTVTIKVSRVDGNHGETDNTGVLAHGVIVGTP